jgi:hypothetical protein
MNRFLFFVYMFGSIVLFNSCKSKPSDTEIRQAFINSAPLKIEIEKFEIKNSLLVLDKGLEIYKFYITSKYVIADSVDNSLGWFGDIFLVDSSEIQFTNTDNGWKSTTLGGISFYHGKKIKYGKSRTFRNVLYEGTIDADSVRLLLNCDTTNISGSLCYKGVCDSISGSLDNNGMHLWDFKNRMYAGMKVSHQLMLIKKGENLKGERIDQDGRIAAVILRKK